MKIEDKLKDILKWLNKHGLEEEAEKLAELISCTSCESEPPADEVKVNDHFEE